MPIAPCPSCHVTVAGQPPCHPSEGPLWLAPLWPAVLAAGSFARNNHGHVAKVVLAPDLFGSFTAEGANGMQWRAEARYWRPA